ncbi:Anti-sigma regulatory factor (Ser/Thr protein kinase) [Actinacidiphila alni]|uniref:Anti-sigma regulatory factor (Ser/Thr protein kinase) n=1 Tax=Actinacidiphila alni TaxID=380248 RepID=A0A1I2IKV4_9ACTN|nr:ATP-binding protein [Actinacidiphila alni]SFF41141.1 Anti-sigma regulatory factor (Ser/Thr protein kinase) [Actinacidiphila alni]
MTVDRPPPPARTRHLTADSAAAARGSPQPFSAAAVRRLVRETVAADPTPCDPRAVGDAVLAASELATNAAVHGGGITQCTVRLVPLGIEVSVCDNSPALPRLTERPPLAQAPYSPGGFGWRLVQQLALRVTVVPYDPGPDGAPRGKRITLVLPLY